MNAQSRQQLHTELVQHIDSSGVATLTLNRPDQRNALSVGLMSAIETKLAAIATDETIRAVVIAANGPAFCSGHDIKEMRANCDEKYYKNLFEQCSRMMLAITRLPQPVIARVHALATAAGCQLIATCDLAIAGRSATFATPGVQIGLFCSTPMVALCRNVGRKKAMEMLLTGDKVDAEQAEHWGLINKVVDDDRLDQAIADITTTLVSKSPLTLSIGKKAFYTQIDMEVEAAYVYASQTMVRNMLAHDAGEGIDAFLEKRQPTWQSC
jgi:enoyl-CoA hydratase/carnithine racemase